jgi:predicted acetyltransferase
VSFEIRPVTKDEYVPFATTTGTAFGNVDVEEQEDERGFFEFERSLAAFDGDRIVGTAGAFTFDLTLPGLTTVPAAGVTWVGVLPTHRRQGILTSLMTRQLDDVHERGEPVAILYASESVIYGRFGYGWASSSYSMEINPRYAVFRQPADASGRLRVVDKEEAGKVLPGLYDQWRRTRPGAVTRRQEWWDVVLKDNEKRREGASARFYVVHESQPGQADGYLTYRVKRDWQEDSASELRQEDLVAMTPQAHTALWRYCLEHDLIRKVSAYNVAVDDPIRWQLADPRRLRVTSVHDTLWARVLDVPAALSARRYDLEGSLVIEVADTFRPQTEGRYRLEGGPDGATCSRTDAEPDLAMSVVDLGAIYLGGVAPSTLATAGRIEERNPGALALADGMFPSTPAPFSNTGF